VFRSLAQCRLSDRRVNSPVIYLSDLAWLAGPAFVARIGCLQVDAVYLKQSLVGHFLEFIGDF